MKLARAASHFDTTVFLDAYSPAKPIYGQMDVYDDSKRDGLMNTRRVFSFSPETVMPARGVLTANGGQWILGRCNVDDFRNVPIRHKYPVQRADGLALVQTTSQLLSGSDGTAAYAGLVWVKDLKDATTDSNQWSQTTLYFTEQEHVVAGMFVSLNGILYYTNNRYWSAAGFLAVEGIEMDAGYGVKTISYATKGAYDAVNDVMSPGVSAQLPAVVMRFQNNYQYRNADSDSFSRGDLAVLVRKLDMAQPVQNESVTIDGAAWRVLDFTPNDDCWLLHVRRA